MNSSLPPKLRIFNKAHLEKILSPHGFSDNAIAELEAVAEVLPFRVNEYVVENLIDWADVPNDPIFQLVFPQPGMLCPTDREKILELKRNNAPKETLDTAVSEIRNRLNPHPAGQQELNVPTLDDERVEGIQHKYRETVLFFPREGQTCHSYCSYCFRWAQFIGDPNLRFQNDDAKVLSGYVKRNPDVTDVIITGGDPMTMNTRRLTNYLEELIESPTIRNIRIGTKALAWWPHRFATAPDSADLLRLFERVQKAGKHLTIMAHSSHPREFSTNVALEAVRLIRSTGAVIRCQAPIIRHVNDNPEAWAELWNTQTKLGAIPYYMFVERDTGAFDYYSLPLEKTYRVFSEAYAQVSGLARTVRGPSMSCTPGKVLVDGITEVGGEKAFALKLVQARDAQLVNKIFFAKYDPEARWLSDLTPLHPEGRWPWDGAHTTPNGHADAPCHQRDASLVGD